MANLDAVRIASLDAPNLEELNGHNFQYVRSEGEDLDIGAR
jgi:hypothetical protein